MKPTECNLALFFIFFRFCAELTLGAPCVCPSQRQQGGDIDRAIAFAFELGPSQRSFPDSTLRARLGALLTHAYDRDNHNQPPAC
jgi:hypothetical protein